MQNLSTYPLPLPLNPLPVHRANLGAQRRKENFQAVFLKKPEKEVMGSNPVEALIFFRLLLSSCLNCKIYCDDHTSLSYHLLPQYKYELFHIYFTWFHCTGRYELNKLTLLPMCGFMAQLVEHRIPVSRRSWVRIPWKPRVSDFFFPVA